MKCVQQEMMANWPITQNTTTIAIIVSHIIKKRAELYCNLKNIQQSPKLYDALQMCFPDYGLRLNIAGGEPLCVSLG